MAAPDLHSPRRGGRAFGWSARSISGILLVVIGALAARGLLLPGQGTLTDWAAGLLELWLGSAAWAAAIALVAFGLFLVLNGPSGRGSVVFGLTIGVAGLAGVIAVNGGNGGEIGEPGAIIVSIGITAVGTGLTLDATRR